MVWIGRRSQPELNVKRLHPKIELIQSLLLSDFPSGSSINYHDGKFYLVGDDSCNILVLDAHYNKVDSVRLFDHAEKRIPKAEKMDLEGSVILEADGKKYLLVLGSASRKIRKRIILIPFTDDVLDVRTLGQSIITTKDFVDRIEDCGIKEINFEGVCLLHNSLVLGNRGNRASQHNHLIITERIFWQRQTNTTLLIVPLKLPADLQQLLGISELCYVDTHDLLLITLTSEATDNAYDDGEIGDSYVAWIKDARTKLAGFPAGAHPEITCDGLINLADADDIFGQEKIEGICVESVKDNELVLHLVSDNDCGESRLFKIKMMLDK